MNLIAVVDQGWGIGKDGDLLFHLKKDMKYFAEKTTGHVIIMGRKTLESFPGGKPLPRRKNIVLTSNRTYDGRGAEVVHSIKELFDCLKKLKEEEIWVVGGGTIYRALLPWCRYAYITHIDKTSQADTFLPDLTVEPGWKMVRQDEEMEEEGVRFHFSVYENISLAETEGDPV